MLKIHLGVLAALICATAHGAVLGGKAVDNIDTRLGLTSILLKSPDSKILIHANDLLEENEVAILDNVLGRNSVANTIKNLLESFRDTVINGSDDIPPLDPLVIDHLGPFLYTYTGVRLTANIRNFRMEGLQWYLVNDVTFSALRLSVGVSTTLPWLIFTGNYDASAWIAFISHRAGGNYRIFINRLDLSADARLGTNILAGHLLLRELNIKIDIHDVHIQVTGMTGSPILNSLINSLVQSVTRDIINEEMENISQLISEALFDIINDILKDFTLDDLLR